MAREWKPGDVAMSRYGVVFFTERGWVFDDGSGPNGPERASYPPRDLRPLAAIDPEDREQIERLADIFCHAPSPGWQQQMQAALREFANPTPPKPEEPTGLGAVVEDADGQRYVRHVMPYDSEGRTTWCDEIGVARPWSRVAAVRVLSEGVSS